MVSFELESKSTRSQVPYALIQADGSRDTCHGFSCRRNLKRTRASARNSSTTSEASTSDSQSRTALTVSDRRESFFIHVKDAAAIDPAVNSLEEKLLAAKLTFQPIPLFVGPLEHLEATYVVVNETKYQVDSALHALNLCLQAFYSLDCKYPDRAKSLWQFIQIVGFQINVKERCSQALHALSGDIEKKILLNTAAHAE
ncbi:hypothetical protein HCN44_009789 [Aphidius gifuensis]|uniref:Uncharacterized protein n=1 Tax=Aphidius gifuensis TaxID=684658 RepID=A0A834Y5C1_APHGI|nr:hypothetical protein HCN44_009789 [Aphidius gifuensis]